MPPEHRSSHGIASSTVERYIRPVAWYYSRPSTPPARRLSREDPVTVCGSAGARRVDVVPGGHVGHRRPRQAYLVGTWPQLRFTAVAVMAAAWSEAMKAATDPTSARDVNRFRWLYPFIHAMSSPRVMPFPDPVP